DLVYPAEAFEMVPIKEARLRCAQRGEDASRIPPEDRTIRHVGEARDGERSRPHAVREIVARRRLRCDPGRPAVRMHIDGYGFPPDVEGRRGSFRRLGGGC